MKTKAQKKETIKNLAQRMPKAEMVIFASFSREGEKGLSVAKTRELKKALKKTGGEYVVAKKKLIGLAAQQAGLGELIQAEKWQGSIGVVLELAGGDSAALSKSVYEFSKANPVFKVIGAILEKRYLDKANFVTLAKLPSREVLLGRALGMMRYPLVGLVNVLQGNIRNLVVVLNQISNKK